MSDSRKKILIKDIFTVPNILSMIRILLIPVIFYLYLGVKNYVLCAVTLAVSYLSDIADGIIARKFNLISNVGKILDPIADKLTQATMLICISIGHEWGWVLFALLATKEFLTALTGFFAVRRTGVVSGAKWFGKFSTVVLNGMFALMLFLDMDQDILFFGCAAVCAAVMIFSTVAYMMFFIKYYDKGKKDS